MKKILLIDDDLEFRDMLKEGLEQFGYQVIDADNGDVGVKLFKEHVFDVVITDIIMPEKEGIETIREIRKMNESINIVAISGGGRSNPEGYLHVAINLGASHVLSKPFKIKDLVSIL